MVAYRYFHGYITRPFGASFKEYKVLKLQILFL